MRVVSGSSKDTTIFPNVNKSSLTRAPVDSPEGDELEVLMTLVEVYEEKNYPMPPSDPVEAIRFRMEQMDIKRKDLESYIGPKSRVSEILNRKRSLSMNQVIKLHRGLGIPYECLLGE